MAAKYFLAKYNKSLKQVKDENESLKKEIELLKNENKKNEKLFILIKESADKGNILSNNILGCMYNNINDIENALKHLKYTSDKGFVPSHFNLGVVYYKNNDIENSMKYFKLALDNSYKVPVHWMEIINKYIPNREVINLKRKSEIDSVPIETNDTKRIKSVEVIVID